MTYYQQNRERMLQQHKEYSQKNREKIQLYHKEYYQKNKKRIEAVKQKWIEKNPEYHKKHRKRYYQEYPERVNKWRQEHRKERNQQQVERRKTDIKFHLDGNMAATIYQVLKTKKAGRKWQELVQYTLEDLVIHLQAQFDKNMSWENYGSYWSIDHIKPRSLFNYISPKDPGFKECWALENLQPMEKIENLKKSNKY